MLICIAYNARRYMTTKYVENLHLRRKHANSDNFVCRNDEYAALHTHTQAHTHIESFIGMAHASDEEEKERARESNLNIST